MKSSIKDAPNIKVEPKISSPHMSKTLKILQLNAQKSPNVQLSLMNDDSLRDYGALILSEPHVWKMDGHVLVSRKVPSSSN